jgi:hypothetical protein
MRNLEKCPECLQRFHVEWQGKFSQKGISLGFARFPNKSVSDDINEIDNDTYCFVTDEDFHRRMYFI